MPKIKITVLISGSGTNLQCLIDATANGAIPDAEIIQVISNRKDAYGLTRAKNAGIPTSIHNLLRYTKKFPEDDEATVRGKYDEDLASIVLKEDPHLVVCAGWMHILRPNFLSPLDKAQVPIINLHPALPGAFDGAKAIERAYEAFHRGEIKETGVMIHYVISEVDRGEPILVKHIVMVEGESLPELERRIHSVEWKAIVEGTLLAISKLPGASIKTPCAD